MFTAFNSETSRPQTVDVDFVALVRLPSTWNNHNNNNNNKKKKKKKKKGIRTEPEVECIEARTRMKAGAPVCSGSLLCSLSNEPRIGLSSCVCAWVCVSVGERERGENTNMSVSYRCVFSHCSPSSGFRSRPSDEPLIPLGLSHSLPSSLAHPHVIFLRCSRTKPRLLRQPRDVSRWKRLWLTPSEGYTSGEAPREAAVPPSLKRTTSTLIFKRLKWYPLAWFFIYITTPPTILIH